MPTRRTVVRQSTLRAPLNEIFGTETSVRLLRVMTGHDQWLPPTELARLAALHLSGIARALEALEEAGIVEYAGTGKRRLARLRLAHPLAPAIRALFEAERARVERLLSSLKAAARDVYPAPMAMWLQGSHANGHDGPEDPVEIGTLSGTRDLERLRKELGSLFRKLEHEFDVTIELRPMTKAELAAAPKSEIAALRSAIPLLGPPPSAFLDPVSALVSDQREKIGTEHPRTHGDIDARALRLGEEVAAALKDDPAIAKRALDVITKRLADASPGERHELREWEHLLRTMPPHRLRAFLRDPGERATRLRQTLPFVAVLDRDRSVSAAAGKRSTSPRKSSAPNQRSASTTAPKRAARKTNQRSASKKK